MSTTKKPVATVAKKETEVKAAEVKAPVVEAKAEVKAEAKAPAKKAAAKKETAVKAPAKKETVKKETVKKETAAKKVPATAAKTAKKEAAPKATKASKAAVNITVQFADKNYTTEDLAKIANDVWVYDYDKKASELKDVQLYVKPEEAKVYYVFNNEITGDFNI